MSIRKDHQDAEQFDTRNPSVEGVIIFPLTIPLPKRSNLTRYKDKKKAAETHLDCQQHHSKLGLVEKSDLDHNGDEKLDPMNEDGRLENIPASNNFMPQSGKPAGVHYEPEKKDSEAGSLKKHVAASNTFMPQAGKPTGTFSR